jgi:hypothetical protein
MRFRFVPVLGAVALVGAISGSASADFLATFDDLSRPPALNSSTSLPSANNDSTVYGGVIWDPRFSVVGDQFRVNPPPNPPPNPVYGIPHSGHFFVTNDTGADGLTITTPLVLTGAWFGRNEYFGFGGGADQVTITAVSGTTDLSSVVFDLPPETTPGVPNPLSFVDLSSFESLSGITGYRINRHVPRDFAVNWVADDFQFSAVVPEPRSLVLLASALPIAGLFLWRRPALSRRHASPQPEIDRNGAVC